jgi:hypothetical protein
VAFSIGITKWPIFFSSSEFFISSLVISLPLPCAIKKEPCSAVLNKPVNSRCYISDCAITYNEIIDLLTMYRASDDVR